MRKIWFGIVTILFFSSSHVFGYDATYLFGTPSHQSDQTVVPPDQAVVPPENFTVPQEESSGLTPKRSQSTTVVQHVPVPLPIPVYQSQPVDPYPAAEVPIATVALRTEAALFQSEPAAPSSALGNGGVDPYIFTELERMDSAIRQLQKDTAKPDPKKSFSTPKITGRMLFDAYSIDQPDWATTNYQNKFGLRELRIGVSGTGYQVFDYKAELIVGNAGTINVNDAWIGAKNVPGFGYLRVGHYSVETGIIYLSGSANSTSTDYLPPSTTFYFARRFGISSEHLFAQDRIRWFYGVFQGKATNADRFIEGDDQGYIFNTRLTMAPYYESGGRRLLHIGGHYSYVTVPDTTLNTTVGGKGWLTQTLKTGPIEGENHHRAGGEFAYQNGPLGAISEVYLARYGRGAAPTRMATGASLELSYFLTGEHRAYNLAAGTLGAPEVNRPFQPVKCGGWNLVNGPGAWQVFSQYSYIDFGDWRWVTDYNKVVGGREHDLTFGVNWFWTSNLRWTLEYTHSQRNTGLDRKYNYEDIVGANARIVW